MWHHYQCIYKARLQCELSEHASSEYPLLENPFHTGGTSKKPLDNGELEGEVEATGVVEEAIIEAEEEGAIDLAGSFLRSTCVILQFSYACCAVTKKSLFRERCIYQNAITLLGFSLLPCSVWER